MLNELRERVDEFNKNFKGTGNIKVEPVNIIKEPVRNEENNN